MRFDKFTIKSQELIQNAQSMASEHNNQQIEPEHMLKVLLVHPEGIIPSVLKKMGVEIQAIHAAVDQAVDNLPRVSGAGMQIYMSSTLNQVLEKEPSLKSRKTWD